MLWNPEARERESHRGECWLVLIIEGSGIMLEPVLPGPTLSGKEKKRQLKKRSVQWREAVET